MPKKQFTKEFKEGVVNYVLEHQSESGNSIAKQFGIGTSTLFKWIKEYKDNGNKVIARGSGNYESDEAKEYARIKKELKDTKDALEVLKKAIGILGK